MKQPLIYIFMLMLFAAALHAQEAIDTAQFWAEYKFSWKTAPEQPDYEYEDWLYLDMGNKATKCFSRYGEIRDSIKSDGLKNGLSGWEIHDLIKGYIRPAYTPTYYPFYDEKKTRTA